MLCDLSVFYISRAFVSSLLMLCSSTPICSMLADKLNMTPEEAERWIVNLIRNARLDAKIDSKLVRKPRGLLLAFPLV